MFESILLLNRFKNAIDTGQRAPTHGAVEMEVDQGNSQEGSIHRCANDRIR